MSNRKQVTNYRPTVLIAMGGHAFMQGSERGTIEEHHANAERICGHLVELVQQGYNMVITHGNGPQVGNLLLQNELVGDAMPTMPLDVLVAHTGGSLGYILQQATLNHLRRLDISRYVVTVICQVLVDPDDEAFLKPSKPIGPFLSRKDAEERQQSLGWAIAEDAGRGWRRVVPSPRPRRIVQRLMISEAAQAGHIVIACGGGGIPIVKNSNDDYVGVEAVIDKDLTSALLANECGADLFVILTNESQVYVDYRKPEQRALNAVTLQELERLRDQGHFPAGSMGPKIEAVCNFLRGGGKRAVITSPDNLAAALDGVGGSHFIGRC